METYTILKKGETVRHCLNIPTEFVDQELEITIRLARKVGDLKKRLMLLFEKNRDINPFESIDDPVAWQKEQRCEPR